MRIGKISRENIIVTVNVQALREFISTETVTEGGKDPNLCKAT